MNDTLKVAGRIGAELGAAKAENDRLRAEVEALRVALLGIAQVNPAERCIEWAKSYASDGLSGTGSELYIRWLETFKEAEALRKDADRRATLSQQPEPTDTYTAVDMATAAAQGLRDGQAAVEQAPVQDEREAVERLSPTTSVPHCGRASEVEAYMTEDDDGEYMTVSQHERIVAALTRPAQTEQQPVGYLTAGDCFIRLAPGIPPRHDDTPLYTAPIAQTAPQGKFRMGDLVKKSTGSEWEGRVVGWYSTEQTPEGYAVESSAHRNSVQIYPVTALEAVE